MADLERQELFRSPEFEAAYVGIQEAIPIQCEGCSHAQNVSFWAAEKVLKDVITIHEGQHQIAQKFTNCHGLADRSNSGRDGSTIFARICQGESGLI